MIKHNNKNQYIKNLRELLSEDLDSVIKREQSTFDNLVYPYNDRLVLFGAGGLGKKVLQGLRQIGTEPLAFVDNNPSFWQEKIDGLVVFDPKTASLRYGKDSVFIVTIWRAGGDHRLAKTQKQLKKKKKNFFYLVKKMFFFFFFFFLYFFFFFFFF